MTAGQDDGAPTDAAPTGGAQLALVLGAIAMIAIPLSFSWALRPETNPPEVLALIPIVQFGGLFAALTAFLFGRRARAAGDRSTGAVWGPRLGGAAFVGYTMLVLGVG